LPEQKISRVLFPAKGGTMIIYLGLLSPKDSSDLPGSYPSPSAQDKSSPKGSGWSGQLLPSLLGLALRWGLPKPVLPRERVVSYTTFSPLARWPVCFLWHFPSLAGPRVTWHLALESSDFPPRFPSLLGQGLNLCPNLNLKSERSSILLWQL